MHSKKIGVLYSGGLDSSALIAKLINSGHEVWPIYIECGLPWEKTEKYWAGRFLKELDSEKIKPVITVRLLLERAYENNWSLKGKTPGAKSSDDKVFLPARNLLLIIKALLALSSRNVWELSIATLKGNPFPDATKAYFRKLEALLSESFIHPIIITVPFRNTTKAKILAANRNAPLGLSFSCINPRGRQHCGICNKCAERKKAFNDAGVVDETPYKNKAKLYR